MIQHTLSILPPPPSLSSPIPSFPLQHTFFFLFPPPLTPHSPAHPLPEVVDLSVCVLDDNGEQRTLYKTQFAFVTDQKQYMAQLLLGSVSDTAGGGEGDGGHYPIFPPLPSAEALREYDQSLTDALMDSDLPPGWTLVGYNNHNTINSVQGMYVHMYVQSMNHWGGPSPAGKIWGVGGGIVYNGMLFL